MTYSVFVGFVGIFKINSWSQQTKPLIPDVSVSGDFVSMLTKNSIRVESSASAVDPRKKRLDITARVRRFPALLQWGVSTGFTMCHHTCRCDLMKLVAIKINTSGKLAPLTPADIVILLNRSDSLGRMSKQNVRRTLLNLESAEGLATKG